MYAGKSGWSVDGFIGRIMRSLLQLRTSEGQPGESQRVSLTDEPKPTDVAPKIRFRERQIEMAHGAGGKASRRLIEGLFVPLLANPILETLSDSALCDFKGSRIATTADGSVVTPLRFPAASVSYA